MGCRNEAGSAEPGAEVGDAHKKPTLARLVDQRGGGRGLISICTAGGMGVTAIVEK